MSSEIVEALRGLGLLEQYQQKFEEENVDDLVVEEWLQNLSLDGLKKVINSAGHRTVFIRAFQQLSSNSLKSNDLNGVAHSSSAQHAQTGSTKIPENKIQVTAPAMWEKDLESPLRILESSKYFTYPNAKGDFYDIAANLTKLLAASSFSKSTIIRIRTTFWGLSTHMQTLNNQNRQRRLEVEEQIKHLFESLRISEFQRLKQISKARFPEPFLWTIDVKKLERHVDPFINDLVTSNSSTFDLDFQKECRETCALKIQEIFNLSNFSSLIVNEYSRLMRIELVKTKFMDNDSEIRKLHGKTLSSAFERCSSKDAPTFSLQDIVWSSLDDLTKSIILDYGRKFRQKNNRHLINNLVLENEVISDLDLNVDPNVPIFAGGIAIHFTRSTVHVGCFKSETGFTKIGQDIPPLIVFTPNDIIIGKEVISLETEENSGKFVKIHLFDLLQSDKNYAQRLFIKNRVKFLRTEEILAISTKCVSKSHQIFAQIFF